MKVEVSLALNTFENFSYEMRDDVGNIREGMRVIVPVWNRVVPGWIVNTGSEYKGRVKPVLGVVESDYLPDPKFLNFIREVSKTFLISPGKLMDLSLSPVMRSLAGLMVRTSDGEYPVLRKSLKELEKRAGGSTLRLFYKNREKIEGVEELTIQEKYDPRVSGKHSVCLNPYRGEYYNEIWEQEKSESRSPLLLLPNNLSMGRYKNELIDLNIYNSEVKGPEREKIWSMARGEEPIFIGGGESALFLPVSRPGTIIIEKPGSFFYSRNLASGIDLREAARIKAGIMGVDLVEGSSSLRPDHYYNRKSIRIKDERPGTGCSISVKKLLPGIKIPPEQIIDTIVNHFMKGDQVLVIASRKGAKKFLFCSECKSLYKCPSCGTTVTVSSGPIITCPSCSYSMEDMLDCGKCGSVLKIIEDISVSSLKKKLIKRAGEQNVFSLEPSSKKKSDIHLPEPGGEKGILILTPAEAGSVPVKSFDHVVVMKPESFFDLNTFNGGEQIYSFVNSLREVIAENGEIEVYTVFHFHYSLKKINDEEQFIERELKYREFFKLPPYYDVFDLKFSDRDLRKLAAKMRGVCFEYGTIFPEMKSYLESRKKVRGFYKGNIRVHVKPGLLFNTGIRGVRGIKIKKVGI